MNFPDAIKTGFQNYILVSGRAARSEYWYWTLFIFIAAIILGIADGALFTTINPTTGEAEVQGFFGTIFSLATLLPGICVSVRRLHDVDKSGWFLLLAIIPIIGWIILIVWACTKGTTGDNRFGPDPLS